jgi:hypothetical protein
MDIPTDPKKFKRWLAELEPALPADLLRKGVFVSLNLAARDQRATAESYAFRKAGIADWNTFVLDPRLLPAVVDVHGI